jgi:phospholipid transport system substrate-binding protein
MKFSEINNMTLMTRRSLMAAGAAAVVFPQPGFALSAPAAQELVTRLIADVNTVISSGKSEAGMIVDLARPSIATPMCPQSRAIALGLMRGPRLHLRWRHIRLRLPTI